MSYKRKIILLYILIGAIWILITDFLLVYLNMEIYLFVQRFKGLFFVLLTGAFIYYALGKVEQVKLLKNEKERLNTLINSMVDFVNFKDGQGRWIKVNQFGLDLFQLNHVDYRGKTDRELAEYTDFYHDALVQCYDSDEETWKSGEITRVEEKIPMPDGTTKTFETIKVPLFEANKERKGLVVIGREITERIEATQLMKASELKYRSLFHYNPELVFIVDILGNFIEVNPKFEPLTGYEADYALGRPITEFVANKSDQQRVLAAIQKAIEEKESVQTPEIVLTSKKENPHTVHCVFVPIINEEHGIQGIIGYTTDMTQTLATEEKLRTTEKLAVVGELAAGIAHEIRNPLTSLKGFVQLFQYENTKDHFIHNIMLDELERINTIVSELLVLSRPQELVFSPKNLNEMMDTILTLYHSEMNLHGVSVSIDKEENNLIFECEPNQIKQLFLNIIKNSTEASASHIHIRTFQDGEYLRVTVQDNGCGIEKDRLKKIGEPFYSQKEKGTGLGLTVSFKIIEAHKGTIHYDSVVNEGTTVTMKFPIKRD
ncbi:hypothetical protein BTS2_2927 [Bacillus sp. TS-2]|nr:hypothetical protein BTS2_2927 [Bacillus sp. TS-2]